MGRQKSSLTLSPAKWMTRSKAPVWKTASISASSVMSTWWNTTAPGFPVSSPTRWIAASHEFTRLSTMTHVCPAFTSSSTVWHPMKPLPPVTRIRRADMVVT